MPACAVVWGRQGSGAGAVPPVPEVTTLSSDEELRAAGVRQSRLCRDNGSPMYAAIIDALVSRLGGDDPAVMLLRSDPGAPVQSALYLRLLGAVHRIALSWPDCPLRRYFPSAGGQVDPPAAVEAFFGVVAAHRAAVAVDMRGWCADQRGGEVGPLVGGDELPDGHGRASAATAGGRRERGAELVDGPLLRAGGRGRMGAA